MTTNQHSSSSNSPTTPSNRRTSFTLGGGNDGHGGAMFQKLEKKRTKSMSQKEQFAGIAKEDSIYEGFKKFVSG